MAINITPTVIPQLVVEHLHIDQLTLLIDRITGNKKITALGTAYALTQDGDKVFNTNPMTVNEHNMDLALVTWAIMNGEATDQIDAIAKLNAARAAVTTTAPDIFTLMAYFEQASGKIFEVAGKTTVIGVG